MSSITITTAIPARALRRLVHTRARGRKVLLVSVTGAHAAGFANPTSPIEIKAVFVEPTENLVGLTDPRFTENWVDEFEGHRIDYSALEVGSALRLLHRGDGAILETILAPEQLLENHDASALQRVGRDSICKRLHNYYKNFCKGVMREYEANESPSAHHMLSVYRTTLTGVHLFRSGELELDLRELCRCYKMREIEALIELNQARANAVLEERGRWVRHLVRMHALLEEAVAASSLTAQPARTRHAEDYLLDLRRRFFDAQTLPDV
jgi:predicted nucleotidyltransferase